MNHAFVVDSLHKRVFEVWDGCVTSAALSAEAYRYILDPILSQGFDILIDVRLAHFEVPIEEALI